MVETPTDHSILIKIQESIAALRSEMGQFRQSVDTRFERVESLIRKQRRHAAGMLVMMRAAASDFDERVTEVEERMAAPEAKMT
ncbi:hypothetical protein [Bradyrhizobium sp. HKCCYLR1023]|uniref:hypothetical protein n=1 Tax=Bradyrhizobium TaxID=374 RepID=UPI003EBCCE8D